MAKRESVFQKEFNDILRDTFPGCLITKNDSGYIQGIPDWVIYYGPKWAMYECKRSEDAHKQPNQEYYVDLLDHMSFARFVYPENADEVLEELYLYFTN